MAVSALSAARTICELRNWDVSNLEIQKILYIAHMIYIGENDGHPLINGGFEAWDYGPVSPAVYHRVKGFGSNPVKNVFHWIEPVPEGTSEYHAIEAAVNMTSNMSASKLISVTHWDKGAWYKSYNGGERNIPIPNNDIAEEFLERLK